MSVRERLEDTEIHVSVASAELGGYKILDFQRISSEPPIMFLTKIAGLWSLPLARILAVEMTYDFTHIDILPIESRKTLFHGLNDFVNFKDTLVHDLSNHHICEDEEVIVKIELFINQGSSITEATANRSTATRATRRTTATKTTRKAAAAQSKAPKPTTRATAATSAAVQPVNNTASVQSTTEQPQTGARPETRTNVETELSTGPVTRRQARNLQSIRG